MAQQLKSKAINVVPGQISFRQCEAKFLLETDSLYWGSKFESATDTNNEFIECQTPKKKLQSICISPVSLHASMKTLKRNISEAYKVQGDYLKDSEFDSHNRNDMEEKLNDFIRLHKAMQEKLKAASYSEQIQILTLVSDNGLKCTAEYFNVFGYIVKITWNQKFRWNISKNCS